MNADDELISPAEAEAARLLRGLRTAQPAATDLVAFVTRHARWQRVARHALVVVSTAVASIAGALGFMARRRP